MAHPTHVVTPSTKRQQYDVIVVGSGAAGGQSAYTLCMEGAKVLMLEAGRNYVPEQETPMFQTPDQAPLRGTATPDMAPGLRSLLCSGHAASTWYEVDMLTRG